jgi:hypothetical protein
MAINNKPWMLIFILILLFTSSVQANNHHTQPHKPIKQKQFTPPQIQAHADSRRPNRHKKQQRLHNTAAKRTRALPPIDTIITNGAINLEIIAGQSTHKITLIRKGDAVISVRTRGHAVYITSVLKKEVTCPQTPVLKIYLHQLHGLCAGGAHYIHGVNISTGCGLNITDCGAGKLCLRGQIHLVNLINSGNSAIILEGVNSGDIHVLNTRNGTVRLFGNTNLLFIRAFNNTCTDTRFLHSCTAFVQAEHAACVTVCPRIQLRAFAAGCSNIYYYTKPCDVLVHNRDSGNVIMMCHRVCCPVMPCDCGVIP